MPSVQLDKAEFRRRFLAKFYDPHYEMLQPELDKIVEAAWFTYDDYHKSPRTRKAGAGFADPEFELPIEWLDAREAVIAAERIQRDPQSKSRVLIVNGSARNDQTCPGEMSKTFRLASIAQQVIDAAPGFDSEILDLSRLSAEYGKVIYPCKACISTA